MNEEIESIGERVGAYVSLYNEILGNVKSEGAALVVLQEMGRDRRVEVIARERCRRNEDCAATARQRAFLERLGVQIPETLSKKEASELIDQALGKEE